VRQGVQKWIKVVPVLSAEIGIVFALEGLRTLENRKIDYFLNKIIGKNYQNRS
jgi:hypothetical protein